MTNEEAKAWCKKYGRQYCCRETPYNGIGRVMHEEAREIHDWGDTRRMKCLVCGTEWTEELPQ
jgi:hypothetical protein